MRAKVLGIGVLAGLFALSAGGPVANAIPITTTPEVESFTLTAPQVVYTVTKTTEDSSATVTNNSVPTPQTASQDLTFNQFDGGLGILTGVTITYSTIYGATATVTVQNNGDSPDIDFFSDASVNHSLTNALLIDPQSSLQLLSATCTPALDAGCTNSQADNGISFDNPLGGVGLAAPLASFVGSGTYDLTATLSSALAPRISPDNGSAFADNSTFDGTLDATWNGSVTVVYTYEPFGTSVPMPSSLYLLVAGLGGIALSRRYRR